MNFLNDPRIYKSEIPSKIALFATLLALGELIFTLVEMMPPLHRMPLWVSFFRPLF
jgi:hypothetical protein